MLQGGVISHGVKSTFPIELGIEVDDLVRPLDDGRDVATGSMIAGSQIKIAENIVVSPSVLVMDGLFVQERTSESALHDVAMLEDFTSPLSRDRDSKADVALSSDRTIDVSVGMLGVEHGAARGAFALSAAVEVSSISSATAIPYCGYGVPAHDTGLSSQEAPTFAAADARAVHRVFSECGVITAQLTRISLKSLATVLAGKVNRHSIVRSAMDCFVSAIARAAAVFLYGIYLFCNSKNLLAVLAGEISWRKSHWYFPCVMPHTKAYSETLCGATIFEQGVA